MSSTNGHGYVPLDSTAPTIFSSTTKNNYVDVAFIMLMLYDHVITLDVEIELIWTLRLGLPKLIFLVNRYLLTSFMLMTGFSPSYKQFIPLNCLCKFMGSFLTWLPIFTFSAAELLMIIRVCSLYGHRKPVVLVLSICFIFAVTSSAAMQVLFMRSFFSTLWYEHLPGCYIVFQGAFIQWHAWVPALSLEGILMLLTACKVFSYRNDMNRTITVLARDSAIYFAILFVGIVLTVVDAVHNYIPVSPLLPTQCITSIAVGRMMMNIRGLILGDPEHTVHLARTLEFASRHDSGLEVEEQA
ncbi:hypothetical protein PILCRDRAFT_172884 [Piloderma croceum F 1598]|uniref:DUF6533 domain-containing protein n=1 Tax=Piloderma croceum (strain F 1598) TaxID=765440 RepID=A0A0C3CKE1_PILCF|nr:hypothetical protein PILCRDRAFT_172884 [Piloderma croceum F 1598]